MGVNIILATSLNIINGNMGEFSCGHAGFMAVGAYVSSLLSVGSFHQEPGLRRAVDWPGRRRVAFPAGARALAASLVEALVAIPSFKTRGDYLAIITIAAAYIVKSTIENIGAIGGARGSWAPGAVMSAMNETINLPWILIWVFVGTVFSVWLIRRFIYSTFGKGVDAICQDEIAAEIARRQHRPGETRGLHGLLRPGRPGRRPFAHILGYVNPGTFTILKSTEIMVMVYLGGMGSLSGSVLAAILMTLLIEYLRDAFGFLNTFLHYISVIPDSYEVTQVWKWVVIPLLLVLLMQFRPEGIMGRRELADVFPGLRKFYKFKG